MRRFRAPGRVNLIGEHTDYNDGFVLPVAIEFETVVRLDSEQQNRLVATSKNQETRLDVGLKEPFEASHDWHDYVLGVANELRKAGIALASAELHFESDLPMGAGLSSSAALEVSAGLALLAAANTSLPPLELAKVCQQ